jgi:hypothetical protein
MGWTSPWKIATAGGERDTSLGRRADERFLPQAKFAQHTIPYRVSWLVTLVEQLSTSVGIRPGHCVIDRFGWSLPHTGRG